MMAAMNCLNFVACLSIIYQQGTLLTSIEFILTHPIFAQDLLLLSIAELIGQMFIYQTVERFGFVMFGSSLVVRQIIAALFSNILETSTFQFTFAFGCAVFITHSIMKFRERKNVKLE
jgi:hypothetical protein